MSENTPIACSHCFSDQGLQLDAKKIGHDTSEPCPNSGTRESQKLSQAGLETLAYRFFVWGSLWRARYGAAPLIQFNEHQQTSINAAPWLVSDVQLFERLLGIGFFHYGPRTWMLGEIAPLKSLQRPKSRQKIIERILSEYPSKTLTTTELFYRVRLNPTSPDDINQYDSPPSEYVGRGRLDALNHPVLYGSPDLEVCIHECRVTAEDDLFVATLAPKKTLHLLDLSVLLKEDSTEFESLDISVHMLFLAGKHAYKITRAIANAARTNGFDGIIYPSYFSLLRIGRMPFETIYGISHRKIPQYQEYEEANSIPNFALFGRPVAEEKVVVSCINRLILSRVAYDFHFGPIGA